MTGKLQTVEIDGGRESQDPRYVRREVRTTAEARVLDTVHRTFAKLGPLALAELEDRPVAPPVAESPATSVDTQSLGQFSLNGTVAEIGNDAVTQLSPQNNLSPQE